jgi:hypothetical protein
MAAVASEPQPFAGLDFGPTNAEIPMPIMATARAVSIAGARMLSLHSMGASGLSIGGDGGACIRKMEQPL